MSVKAWLRDRAGELMLGLGMTHPARQAPGQLVIATFHRVLPEKLRAEYPLPGLVVTPTELECFLEYFSSHFAVGTLRESARRWASGEPASKPLMALTFDDAQLDNAEHALPVLDAAGMCATFFAPAGSIDAGELLWHDRLAYGAAAGWRARPRDVTACYAELGIETPPDATAAEVARAGVRAAKRVTPAEREDWIRRIEAEFGAAVPTWDGLMSWDQLRAAAAAGHEIGSHSFSHALLPQCDDAALEREVAGSRRLLEERLGAPVESFCYPNGDRDARTVAAVRAAGYRWAVTTAWGANSPGTPALELARHEMHAEHVRARNGAFSVPRLAWRMSRYHPGVGA